MKDPLQTLSDEVRKKARKRDQPGWTKPMLAKLTDKSFSDENWIFERKLDGERCLVFKKGRKIRFMSRNRKELNDTYPGLIEAVRNQSGRDFIVDGEIVAFRHGRTSFHRLQQRMKIKDAKEARKSPVKVYLYLFDILHVGMYDVTRIPLRHRKSILKNAVSFDHDLLRYLPHRNSDGEKYYREACRKKWEGVIAKDAGSRYVHSRSGSWLKFKCVNQQEFVIGGYTDPKGKRIGLGALLIGFYEEGDLRYAGEVGTGFDDKLLKGLSRKLSSLERKTPPFSEKEGLPAKKVHWVTPKLVGEVGFTEWTRQDKLRHPRFLGLRDDKDPKDVVKEEPGGR
jgi:DNA ligase D-like protein (predicted ligase)